MNTESMIRSTHPSAPDQGRHGQPRSRLKPLALALALAGAAVPPDAAIAQGVMPVPADPPGAATRPDGSTLWFVTNCNDAGAGSLRAAAAHAVAGDGIDLTGLACSTISLSTGAITLHDIELVGPGADHLTIDAAGNQNRRIFNHASQGGTLDISGLALSHGKYISNAGLGGGCLRSDGGIVHLRDTAFSSCWVITPTGAAGNARGGAIASYGASGGVIAYDTTITDGMARTDHGSALGGAIYTLGGILMHTSTISNNAVSASGSGTFIAGGGLFARGAISLDRSTLDGNVSSGGGGGAVAGKGGTLLYSTVSNNVAGTGASGIAFGGLDGAFAAIDSSTISGNTTERSAESLSGGLYFNTVYTAIINTTITRNSETNGDGQRHGAGIVFGPNSAALSLYNTVVSRNYFHNEVTPFWSSDIYGPLSLEISGGTNLVGWSRRPLPADTIYAEEPELGPLQDNGGPTRTHMPLPGSPVIDNGDAQAAPADQRGHARVVGGAADIGAVEADDAIFANGFD